MIISKIIATVVLSANIFVSPFGWLRDTVDKQFDKLYRPTIGSTASSCEVVLEANTMKVISDNQGDEVIQAGHFAKLMTLLVTTEAIEYGNISLEDITSVSKHANSMQGTQIWLDVGEKITIEELIKAITIGNANDACVALAEAVCETEEKFVEKMNGTASRLGMKSTCFADCTGLSEKTTTCAYDIALLTAELSKHEWLFDYTTTWLDNVRGNRTELVNNNLLVKSYQGIIGFKAFSNDNGNFLACGARRNDMTVVCVKMCESDKDIMFSAAKEAMNKAFAAYEIFTAQFESDILKDVGVNCGERLLCSVRTKNDCTVLIPKGKADDIEIAYERVELIPAPVKKGTIVGSVSLILNDDIIFRTDIVTDESVERLTLLETYRRLLLELLNM